MKSFDLKKKRRGQAMTEYAMLLCALSLWSMIVYELMVSSYNAYLQSIHYVLNLALP